MLWRALSDEATTVTGRSSKIGGPETVSQSVWILLSKEMTETRRHPPAWAGILGALLFVAVFAVEDLLDPDFNWLSTAVSEHSRGAHGWIQIATFVVVGALLVVFSRGVVEEFHKVPGTT